MKAFEMALTKKIQRYKRTGESYTEFLEQLVQNIAKKC